MKARSDAHHALDHVNVIAGDLERQALLFGSVRPGAPRRPSAVDSGHAQWMYDGEGRAIIM